MPRRGSIAKRDVLPDPVYGDKVVTKLIKRKTPTYNRNSEN